MNPNNIRSEINVSNLVIESGDSQLLSHCYHNSQQQELGSNIPSGQSSLVEETMNFSQDQTLLINHNSVNKSMIVQVQKPEFIEDDQLKLEKSINITQSQLSITKNNYQYNKENESFNCQKNSVHSQNQSTPISQYIHIQQSQILKQNKSNNKSTIMNKVNDENINIQQKNMKTSPFKTRQNAQYNIFNMSVYQEKQLKGQCQLRSRSTNIITSPLREKNQNSKISSSLTLISLSCEKQYQQQQYQQLNSCQQSKVFQTNHFELQSENQDNIFKLKEESSIQNIKISNLKDLDGENIQELKSDFEIYKEENKLNEKKQNQENTISHEFEHLKAKEQLYQVNFNTDQNSKPNSIIEETKYQQKISENTDSNAQINSQIPNNAYFVGEKCNNQYTNNQTQKQVFNEDQTKLEKNANSQIGSIINYCKASEQQDKESNKFQFDSIKVEQQDSILIQDKKLSQENIKNEQKEIEYFTDCQNEEEDIKSQTIEHLEGYKSIIRETDNYLDQLLMYMAKEKITLINVQKSIQVRPSNRTSPPDHQNQQIILDYSHNLDYSQQNILNQQSNKQEDIKLIKYKDDLQNKNNQESSFTQREQEINISSSSSTQQQYMQTQNSQKVYNYKNNAQISQQQLKQYSHVNQMLNLSIESIKYGIVFPGNIFEEQVQIGNKTNETIFIKVVGLCLNPEFDSHGEYVYSIRKTINYDYNEKLMFSIAPYSTVKVHVALKVPNINQEKILKGSFAVTVNGYDSYISIPITSSVEIPKIICTRQLFHASCSSKVIKLAIRRGKKNDCKIPFKNAYGYSLQIEPFWLTDQTDQKHITNLQNGSHCPFQLNLTPQTITVQPKGLFIINLSLRPNQYFKEYNEKRILNDDTSPLHIKNILIIKISNSSLLLHFPMSLEVY